MTRGTILPLSGHASKPSRPGASTPDVRRRMQRTPQRDTPPERALRSRLHRMGLRFWVDRRPDSSVRSRADIVFPRARVAVFVDGCFWHGCPEHATWPKANGAWWKAKIEANRERDRRSTAALRHAGWRVVRVWEHEDPTRVAKRIANIVRKRVTG
ncbi:MAG: very short patch repair endonuclease [Candidatus Eisenbacteria bacterium]|uniref:Very short patch repair endonuclease n=1 Tax=Eiseniibacteriota bacterium TaxID=2212470 RepID=A0A956NG04_UNCEI|nr:very short patch repair endonuclease [Candidatus Eisenbacteria bacterium]